MYNFAEKLTMTSNSTQTIIIDKVSNSNINNIDFDNLGFGEIFTDHMFECDYVDGEWKNLKISAYHPLTLNPAARVFHYGQAIFEGMKVYKDKNDDVFLFRPDQNFERLNKSAVRLAIPELPKNIFFDGLNALVNLERDWIKQGIGNSLYLRPFIIATEPSLSAAPAQVYKFMIICSPASAYYKDEVRVLFAEKYSRSANGGIGFAKAAGNYAAQFYPTALANKKGYQQIVWTDASTHEYLEEAGTMNVFFRVGDTLLTAPNNDRILDGVTRKSVIQIAKDNNIKIEVRPISVKEIKEAAKKGELKEMFGAGTAAVISPISAFEHNKEVFELPKQKQSYASKIKDKLLNIQYNIDKDTHNWRYKI